MGYTHYFPQHRDFTDQEWETLCKVCHLLMDKAEEAGIVIVNWDGKAGTKPEIEFDEGVICFNGEGEDSHESMVLTKVQTWEDWQDKNEPPFAFCKTAQKPYDTIVTALLGAAHVIAKGALVVTSDGDFEEWQPGLELAEQVLHLKSGLFKPALIGK